MNRYRALELVADDGLPFGVVDTTGTEILGRTGTEANAGRITAALNAHEAAEELAESVLEYDTIARLYQAAMDWFPDDVWRRFEASPEFANAEQEPWS
jgi:hypothetical protein